MGKIIVPRLVHDSVASLAQDGLLGFTTLLELILKYWWCDWRRPPRHLIGPFSAVGMQPRISSRCTSTHFSGCSTSSNLLDLRCGSRCGCKRPYSCKISCLRPIQQPRPCQETSIPREWIRYVHSWIFAIDHGSDLSDAF